MSYRIVYVISVFLIINEFYRFAGAQGIGVCYGRNSSNLPIARKAIELCQSNNIQRIQLYDPNHDALYALRNTGIQVILGVSNEDIISMAQNQRFAKYWVNKNVVTYASYINFRCIVVGHDIDQNYPLHQYILPAMQRLQQALYFFNLSIALSNMVSRRYLDASFPPSAGTFGPANPIVPIVQFMESNEYPLLVMVDSYYIFFSDVAYYKFPLDYALLNSTEVIVQDGALGYTNLLDGFVDTFYTALEKVFAPNVEIIVTQTGWPSDPRVPTNNGSMLNAQIHNNNLIKRLRTNTGTPKRPGRPLESYIYSLFNQDLLGFIFGSYGLFNPDMTPAYSLDFWYSPPK